MHEIGADLSIEEVAVDAPGPHEVLVRTVACGVCHSDLHILEGKLPYPLPTVLGHEPAGIVLEVGSQVSQFAPGDHVIGCLSVFCGQCEYCADGRPNLCGGAATARAAEAPPRLSLNGAPLNQFTHLSAFAERMLVHENALVKIRDDMPLDRAALIGCGITTGLGAALNRARVRAGRTAAVIGCGGVGLAIVQGCRIAGAARIFAVDTVPWKLELARQLGATDTVDPSAGSPVKRVLSATGGGVDYAFEAIGLPATAAQAVSMARAGGTAVLVGVLPAGETVAISGADLIFREKAILGCMMGTNRFRVDMPRYVDLYLSGRLKLDEMISARVPLERVNDSFAAMKNGEVARSVIVFDESVAGRKAL